MAMSAKFVQTEIRDQWLSQDDEALLRECRVDTYRAGGPGGQHRNKVSSAVRLLHNPTGLLVIAEEERSQHANKARAVKRLRMAIALHFRAAAHVPDAVRACLTKDGRLMVASRNPVYPQVVASVLDLLAAHNGQLREAAGVLGLTSSQLSRFITHDGKVLAEANHLRQLAGLRPLS